MAEQQLVKSSLSLPEQSMDTLRQLAKDGNTSMAEIIRRSIEVQKFLRDTRDRGGKILIKDKDDKMSELVLL